MPKAHIRNGELPIPLSDEIREKLDVHEGEELAALWPVRSSELRRTVFSPHLPHSDGEVR